MTTTEDHSPAHDTTGLVPQAGRLHAVLASRDAEMTDALEYATQLLGLLWGAHLAAGDLREIAAVDARELAEADADHVGHQHGWKPPSAAVGWSRVLTRAIDDEVSRRLGNRADAAVLVDDDFPRIVTAGELIDRLAMTATVLRNWPPSHGMCPLGPVLADVEHAYDTLVTGMLTGDRRQPRRRSHGAPPIPRPPSGTGFVILDRLTGAT
ncbi:hypothetical protein [Nocardia blacklockiae]|uniref:hypothetical protein n=1 Tax=Nocardia blacklockiae TaxID=480036 RepID=UPI001894D09E|nr:hypothetical protein [Nocardia blacklockiae]MBF6171065.1 hypothetical protein [Nocardia blacklockiae]